MAQRTSSSDTLLTFLNHLSGSHVGLDWNNHYHQQIKANEMKYKSHEISSNSFVQNNSKLSIVVIYFIYIYIYLHKLTFMVQFTVHIMT